jgi:HK97 gp10 family phage protein
MSTMVSKWEGIAELEKKLRELGDPKQQANTLRAAVRGPMREVMAQARVNISQVSPGDRGLHKTYRGRLVSRGFAARNIKMITKMSRDKQSASAILGVKTEAYYALQFHELGTSKLRARPWLVPAFEQSKDDAVRQIGAVLRARIERIAKARASGATPGSIRPEGVRVPGGRGIRRSRRSWKDA